MDTGLFEALSIEAQRMGVIDPDVVKCHRDLTDGLDASDSSAIHAAVQAMKARSPVLFNETHWDRMDDARFAEMESRFRESLRINPKATSNEFKALDTALCSEEEQAALRRYLGGRAGSFEKSILRAALKRQQHQGLTPSGDAA